MPGMQTLILEGPIRCPGYEDCLVFTQPGSFTVRIIDVKHKVVRKRLVGQTSELACPPASSPDVPDVLVTTDFQGLTKKWDLNTGKCVATLGMRNGEDVPVGVCLGKVGDRSFLFLGLGQAECLHVWDLDNVKYVQTS